MMAEHIHSSVTKQHVGEIQRECKNVQLFGCTFRTLPVATGTAESSPATPLFGKFLEFSSTVVDLFQFLSYSNKLMEVVISVEIEF